MTLPRNALSPAGTLNRRRFLGLSTATAVAGMLSTRPAHAANPTPNSMQAQTGNGEWTYRAVPRWGELPPGTTFGGTHGAIATDKAGMLYVSTQSDTGTLVYDATASSSEPSPPPIPKFIR